MADGSTLLRLLSGVASFFSRRPHALEVDTPFANAAVEGTEFAVAARARPDPGRRCWRAASGSATRRAPCGVTPAAAAVAVAGKAPRSS